MTDVRSKRVLVHATAYCIDCMKDLGADLDNYRVVATLHALQTGHEVKVETGYSQTYGGTP